MSETRGDEAPLLARLSVIPVAAALVSVILHGAFGIGRDTQAKIHDLRNPRACSECHLSETDSRMHEEEPALCYRCHEDARGHGAGHSLGEVVTADSGLGGQVPAGEILWCSSCHDPHGKARDPQLLRQR